MKILENISSGYKRIATGIAIVAFLSMLYLAMIPGASVAYVYGASGEAISGALVFIKEWPQYNATTDINGAYTIDQMPIGEYTLVARHDYYAPNLTSINVTTGSNLHNLNLTPAINYYVPFLYQREDHIGFDYDSTIQIVNKGTVNASVEILVQKWNDGTVVSGDGTFIVKPNESLIKNPFELNVARPTYFGPLYIKSDNPVKIGGYIKTTLQDVYSLGPSFNNASTKSYIPFLYQRTDNIGLNYDSGLQIFNPGDVNANVTINLYNWATGAIVANKTIIVTPKADILPKIIDIYTGIPTVWFGPAEVTSDQPVVVQGYIRTTASMIYSIAPSIDTTVTSAYIPFLYQRTDNIGLNYDSGLQVFNPGDINANVTINLYNWATGAIVANKTFIVTPKAVILPKIPDIYTGVPTVWFGPAEITSDQPIVAQGYIRTTDSKVYSVAPQVRRPETAIDVNIPFLYSPASGSHDAGLQVFNANGIQANINIKLYYSNGTLAGSKDQLLNPMQEYLPKVFDIAPSNIDFKGYAIVTTDQPVVAQGFIRTKGTKNIYSIAPPVER